MESGCAAADAGCAVGSDRDRVSTCDVDWKRLLKCALAGIFTASDFPDVFARNPEEGGCANSYY